MSNRRDTYHSRFELEQLEPRVLLSGDTAVSAPLLLPPSSAYAGVVANAQQPDLVALTGLQANLFGDVGQLESLSSQPATNASSTSAASHANIAPLGLA